MQFFSQSYYKMKKKSRIAIKLKKLVKRSKEPETRQTRQAKNQAGFLFVADIIVFFVLQSQDRQNIKLFSMGKYHYFRYIIVIYVTIILLFTPYFLYLLFACLTVLY